MSDLFLIVFALGVYDGLKAIVKLLIIVFIKGDS